MSVIYVVLPLALVLAGVFVALFFWAVRRGQFDDLETPAVRLALEDRDPPERRPPAAADAHGGTAAGTGTPPAEPPSEEGATGR